MSKGKTILSRKPVLNKKSLAPAAVTQPTPEPEPVIVPGETRATPFTSPAPPVVEPVPEVAAPVERPVELVKCRYCGAAIPKPADSTFYQCNACVGTGTIRNDRFGRLVVEP